MSKINKVIIGICTLILLANISLGAVELVVSPEDSKITGVMPGGSINYTANVVVTEDLAGPQDEDFSIVNTTTGSPMAGWGYAFDPVTVRLQGTLGESNSSRLTITVPGSAHPGNYTHTVYATGYDELGRIFNISTELDSYVYDIPVFPVPELNTFILITTGIFGLMLLARRGRED